jgi:hypothetical protein
VAPSWLRPPLSLEETAEAFIRPSLRRAFLELCTRPAAEYVGRFGFKSDLLKVWSVMVWGFGGVGLERGRRRAVFEARLELPPHPRSKTSSNKARPLVLKSLPQYILQRFIIP